MLTGVLPGKRNAHFHDLLRAAAITVFGEMADNDEPNWEWQTKTAVDRLKAAKQPK
jgi:hypothetical protein